MNRKLPLPSPNPRSDESLALVAALVAGTAVFGEPDPAAAARSLLAAAGQLPVV